MTWYAIVSWGSDPAPSSAPTRSLDEIDAKFTRFQRRYRDLAGTYLASGSVRVHEYPTRALARQADISDQHAIMEDKK